MKKFYFALACIGIVTGALLFGAWMRIAFNLNTMADNVAIPLFFLILTVEFVAAFFLIRATKRKMFPEDDESWRK